jgi:tetratricopeptide (TPR) repeat protein
MHRYIALFLVVFSFHLTLAQDQLSQNRIEKLYRRGTELVDHANYGAARQAFTDFLQAAPATDSRRAEAEYYVAFSALTLGHRDGEKLIADFIDNNAASPKAATAYYDLANFFYSQGNYVKASNYYHKVDFAALTSDQQAQAHFKWGYAYFNQKKLDEALEQFNFVKRISNSYAPAANYYAGFIEYSRGKFDEALTDLKKAEANTAYAKIVPYLIVNIYYRQGRYDTMLEYANTLKGRTDVANQNEIAVLIAEAQYYKGDYKKALEAYEKYLDSAPKAESSLLFRAGFANYTAGNTDKAITYLERAAAAKDTVGYYASYYLGVLYLKKGNKPYALNSFNHARKNPKDLKLAEESSFQYAKVAYDAGKPDLAIDEFEKYLQQYPRSPHAVEVNELLAQAYVNGNNYNKAIEYIEALPSRNQYIDQAFQKASFLKGSELFNKGEYEQAVAHFNKSLEYPKDRRYVALASFWNGEAYSIGRRHPEAIASYQRVIGLASEADPDILLKSRYGLGYAYYNTKEYDKALANFNEFLNKGTKATPNYADAVIRMADCYYVKKQYADALTNYNKARTLGSPDNDYVLLQLGVINGIQSKYPESKSMFAELAKSYPKSRYRDEAIYQLAQFDIEQGNYQAAIDGLSQIIRTGTDARFIPLAYMRRGASFFNLKQYDKTIGDYSALIQQYPSHPAAQEVLLPLQEAMNLAGKSGDFDKYLAMIKSANPDSQGLESVEFETAKNLYFDQQYPKAIINLKGFLASYPQSAKAYEAKYYIAESHYRLREYDPALPLYQELAEEISSGFAGKSVGRVAEIEFKQGRFDNAIVSYRKFARLATNKKDQYTGWSGLMESFYQVKQYDSADVYARVILERGNVNAGAQNKASLYLGKTAFARGDLDGAKDEFLNTLNAARDEFGAEAKYMLAQVFYQQKQYKQSYETLVGLNKDFESYEDWVGKSYLLIADNCVAMDNIYQAKETLKSLIDGFPQQKVKDEAKAKLAAIEKTQADKDAEAEKDTVDINR